MTIYSKLTDGTVINGHYFFHNADLDDLIMYPLQSLDYYDTAELAAIGLKREVVPDVVKIVSSAQALAALADAGLYDAVADKCLNHPVVDVQIWYSRSTVWERYNPYLQAMQLEMGLSDEQVDALFILASKK